MFGTKLLYLPFLANLFALNVHCQANQRSAFFERVVRGYRLKNCLIKETRASTDMECSHLCILEGCHCRSINYKSITKTCQLNNHIAAAPENSLNLVEHKEFDYLERTDEQSLPDSFAARTKALPSCSKLKLDFPGLSSGYYKINPRQNNGTAFEVFCNMSSKNGVGVTVVGHDSEQRTKVNGYGPEGSYKRSVTYNRDLADIAALTTVSKHCEQFIKYECLDSLLAPGKCAWWVSRQGGKMFYWGGAKNNGTCACKLTNSCAGGYACNCNQQNKTYWREDSGFLTDKSRLPVTELRFGDTANVGELGFHTLGKLLCWE